MDRLDEISEALQAQFEEKNAARDQAIVKSRMLIRNCANAIRAVHRRQWEEAQAGLETARAAADELTSGVEGHPDLYYSGYMQDALKELVEAFATYAIVRGEPLPTPEDLSVVGATYLNGLAEAATELRRFALDIIRKGHDQEAEHLLGQMESIYHILMTFDFPDALTYGLRRRSDTLRSVIQRTQGDITQSIRQQRLEHALADLEKKLNLD
ncbi:MAG: haloacid dehalogenase [Chloroflexi bacterium]|nr:haloacid dehalogenase [Chloroflexota bacterium]